MVPGLFGCTNVMSLEQSEDEAVQKLTAYFAWAKTETRLAGFAPWHWGNRHTPQYKKGACNMELGASAMPRTVAKLREMGRWMKANARAKTDDWELGQHWLASPRPSAGFIGTVHPSANHVPVVNVRAQDVFGWGVTMICNEPVVGNMTLKENVEYHCDTVSVNQVGELEG